MRRPSRSARARTVLLLAFAIIAVLVTGCATDLPFRPVSASAANLPTHAGTAPAPVPGPVPHLLRVDGTTRAYLSYVPRRVPHRLPLLVVLPSSGASLDPEALRTWGNEQLANYQRVSRVVVRDELPRAVYGKVAKAALRNEFGTENVK